MLIDARILRAAAHFAALDKHEPRPLCKTVFVQQTGKTIHISATDGYIAAHFRLPVHDEAETDKIGIEAQVLLDRRLRRRQDLKISTDGPTVSMITPDGIPFMQRTKISRYETTETLPLNMMHPDPINTDIPKFIADTLAQREADALQPALDDSSPTIHISQQIIQRIGKALEELHRSADHAEGYDITTTAWNQPAIIEINDLADHFGDWYGLDATFLVMPLHPPHDKKKDRKHAVAGLARIDGDWAVTLTGEHHTRTYSKHFERDDAIESLRSLLSRNAQMETTDDLRPYMAIRTAQQDAALKYFDDDTERAEYVKGKFQELEKIKLAEAAQLRLNEAQLALDDAQRELVAAQAAVLESAQVGEETEHDEPPAHELDQTDEGAFADYVAESMTA